MWIGDVVSCDFGVWVLFLKSFLGGGRGDIETETLPFVHEIREEAMGLFAAGCCD
jgi:hypothetical protein